MLLRLLSNILRSKNISSVYFLLNYADDLVGIKKNQNLLIVNNYDWTRC